MKILIAGGRNFGDQGFLFGFMHKYKDDVTCVISGGAKGADTLGEVWAKYVGVPVERYPADWETFGKAAGPIRNKQMLDEGRPDLVVVFEGGSGSKHMADIATKRGIRTFRPVKFGGCSD